MRREVVGFAVLFAAAPALLLGVAAFSALSTAPAGPPRAPLYGALALLAAVGLVRGRVLGRLSPGERAVVRFFGFAPMLSLLVAGVLGALPLLALAALEIPVGEAGLGALLAAVVAAAGLTLWALWRRFRASLGPPDSGGPT